MNQRSQIRTPSPNIGRKWCFEDAQFIEFEVELSSEYLCMMHPQSEEISALNSFNCSFYTV